MISIYLMLNVSTLILPRAKASPAQPPVKYTLKRTIAVKSTVRSVKLSRPLLVYGIRSKLLA